uniref:Uncharacterized protein n=1 Tax=Oryza punctata TaxID=4537 RepID=A0A0E0KD54_ORYPU
MVIGEADVGTMVVGGRIRIIDVICTTTRGGGTGSGTTDSCLSVGLVDGAGGGGSSPFSVAMTARGGKPRCAYLLLVGLNRWSWCSWFDPLASVSELRTLFGLSAKHLFDFCLQDYS